MRRMYATVAALVAMSFAMKSWASPVDSLGLAESKVQYKINRSNAVVDAKADTLTKILSGDRVQAADKPVRIQTSAGDTVMVQNNSAAEFTDAAKIRVVSGDVLVAVGKNSTLTVGVDDLVVTPLKSAGKTSGQQIVGVARPSDGYVKISGFNQPVAVKTADSDDQLAVVGTNDTVELSKTPKGWVVVQAGGKPAPKAAAPATATKGSKPNEPAEKKEERRGAAWWLSPAALAGGTLLLAGTAVGIGVGVRDSGGGNRNNNNNRPPMSRITNPE